MIEISANLHTDVSITSLICCVQLNYAKPRLNIHLILTLKSRVNKGHFNCDERAHLSNLPIRFLSCCSNTDMEI